MCTFIGVQFVTLLEKIANNRNNNQAQYSKLCENLLKSNTFVESVLPRFHYSVDQAMAICVLLYTNRVGHFNVFHYGHTQFYVYRSPEQ